MGSVAVVEKVGSHQLGRKFPFVGSSVWDLRGLQSCAIMVKELF